MVVLRATRRVLKLLPLDAPETADSDTALGDWYVHRLSVDRKPLLLLISSASLLPLLAVARDVRTLPRRLPELVRERLGRLGVPDALVDAEISRMAPVSIGPTADRSVVGTLVEFALQLPHTMGRPSASSGSLREAEEQLARTPCRVHGRVSEALFPEQRARELLVLRWGDGRRGRT